MLQLQAPGEHQLFLLQLFFSATEHSVSHLKFGCGVDSCTSDASWMIIRLSRRKAVLLGGRLLSKCKAPGLHPYSHLSPGLDNSKSLFGRG